MKLPANGAPLSPSARCVSSIVKLKKIFMLMICWTIKPDCTLTFFLRFAPTVPALPSCAQPEYPASGSACTSPHGFDPALRFTSSRAWLYNSGCRYSSGKNDAFHGEIVCIPMRSAPSPVKPALFENTRSYFRVVGLYTGRMSMFLALFL